MDFRDGIQRLRRYVLPALALVGALLVYRACTPDTRAGFTTEELDADDGAPTVILLHGAGADAADVVPLAEALRARGLGHVRFVMPDAPYRFQGGRTWYRDGAEKARTIERLHELIETLELPANKVIVAGFSRGAELAAAVASAHGPFGGVGLFSGDYPAELLGRNLRGLSPAFVSHGESDPVLAYAGASNLVGALQRAGAVVAFRPFQGGHTIPDDVSHAFAAWLSPLAR